MAKIWNFYWPTDSTINWDKFQNHLRVWKVSNTGLDLMLGTYLGDRFIQFCRNIHIICLKISQSPRVSLRGKMYDTDRLTNSFCHICESIAHLLIPSVFLHFKVHHKAETYFFSSRVFFTNQFLRLSSNQNFHFWLKPKNFFFPRHQDLNLCALPIIQDLNTC